jgi:hypothetical protein
MSTREQFTEDEIMQDRASLHAFAESLDRSLRNSKDPSERANIIKQGKMGRVTPGISPRPKVIPYLQALVENLDRRLLNIEDDSERVKIIQECLANTEQAMRRGIPG